MKKFVVFLNIIVAAAYAYQTVPTLRNGVISKQICYTKLYHRHHDHSHDHQHEKTLNPLQISEPISWKSLKQNFNWKNLFSLPRLGVLAIGALFFVPAIIRRKVARMDIIAFVTTTIILSTYDKLRTSFKEWVNKIETFKNSVIKHTTPITKTYFFKNDNAADRVTILGVWINIILSVIKFAGGIAFNSAVLVADAGHSLSDLLSDFITLWAVQIARIPADDDHPYGHGKFESIGSLFLSLTLVATGLSVGAWSYERMHQVLSIYNPFISTTTTTASASAASLELLVKSVQIPTWPAMILAAISIGSKEWLYRVTKRVGILLNSQIVIANAWHHRSDAFSSVLSLVSIAIAITMPNLLVMDSAAGILIAGMISISGMEILFESIKTLSDTSDKDLEENIATVTKSINGVLGIRNLRTRSVGSNSLIDLTILTDTTLSASAAQSISERVRWKLLDTFPHIVDALVRTHSSSTLCPLLTQNQKTAVDIEKEIRTLLTPCMNNYLIDEIKRVNIYYVNPVIANIEVILKLKHSPQQQQHTQQHNQHNQDISATSSTSSGSSSSSSGNNASTSQFNSLTSPNMTLQDAESISTRIQELIKTNVQDILQVDVYYDLSTKSVETETATNIASLK